MSKVPVVITVHLTDYEAMSLAQVLKRIGWQDTLALSVDEGECKQALTAMEAVRKELRFAGYDPR